jgi:hypothetical protein
VHACYPQSRRPTRRIPRFVARSRGHECHFYGLGRRAIHVVWVSVGVGQLIISIGPRSKRPRVIHSTTDRAAARSVPPAPLACHPETRRQRRRQAFTRRSYTVSKGTPLVVFTDEATHRRTYLVATLLPTQFLSVLHRPFDLATHVRLWRLAGPANSNRSAIKNSFSESAGVRLLTADDYLDKTTDCWVVPRRHRRSGPRAQGAGAGSML